MKHSLTSMCSWSCSGALIRQSSLSGRRCIFPAGFNCCGSRVKLTSKAGFHGQHWRKLHTSFPRQNVRCTKDTLTNVTGTVAKVTICNAGKLNSVNESILQNLTNTFRELRHEEDLRLVILTGEQAGLKDRVTKAASFCGGADIRRMASLSDSEEAKAFITKIHDLCQSIRQLPAIVIARIHGLTLGAGLEIAAACDFRYATSSSTLSMPEVRLGIPSVVEARLLANIVGWSKTREMLFFGRNYSAKEAHAIGLVDEHAATPEELDKLIEIRIQTLTANGPNAMRAQKRLINFWEENDLTPGTLAGIDEFAAMWKDGGSEPKKYMKAFIDRKK